MHEVLVNRLGGLSLPRKSVVRLTDRPNMTLDVYLDVKQQCDLSSELSPQDGSNEKSREIRKVFRIFLKTLRSHLSGALMVIKPFAVGAYQVSQ